MANLLTPIVLNFPDRGYCAVDYIDYFDEGQYGPDKAFFVKRFGTDDENPLAGIAAQMNACLALQNTEGSMIHVNRTDIPDKWMDPMTSKSDPFPRRAQYKIRFLLRIKFYGDYAYIDLGAKWKPGEDLTLGAPIVKATDLTVVNRCWISERDAQYVLDELKESGLNFNDRTAYDASTGSVRELSEEELQEKEAAAEATYLTEDDETLLVDDSGNPITL